MSSSDPHPVPSGTELIQTVEVPDIVGLLGVAIETLRGETKHAALVDKLDLILTAIGCDYGLLLAAIHNKVFPTHVQLRPGLLRTVAKQQLAMHEEQVQVEEAEAAAGGPDKFQLKLLGSEPSSVN